MTTYHIAYVIQSKERPSLTVFGNRTVAWPGLTQARVDALRDDLGALYACCFAVILSITKLEEP